MAPRISSQSELAIESDALQLPSLANTGRTSHGRFPFGSRLRVAVLSGGDSPEREVSLASGLAVSAALEAAGHHVSSLDPAEHQLSDVDWTRYDVCFIALHGGAGEDGRVQRTLESLDVAYTGSRSSACRLAMNKARAKQLWRDRGVTTPSFALLDGRDSLDVLRDQSAHVGYPRVVKPNGQGSSLGVGIARTEAEFAGCIDTCLEFESTVLVESFIPGREFTVTLFGMRSFLPLEIDRGGDLFSFGAKYHDESVQHQFCDPADDFRSARLVQSAQAAARALGTRGLVRVDLILDKQDVPQVLEVNTVPGLTDHSLAPRAAAEAGLPMPVLCHRMAHEALHVEIRP